jgi:putative nucleotidyltransferase with HDIG domain
MKKRILFVDDEPKFLGLYRVLFESDKTAWDVAFASDAASALQAMENTPSDVLVAKWHLPGMTGRELVSTVKERHPGTARIIASESADQEEVVKSLGARHQFIARPVDLTALRSTVWRVVAIQNADLDEKIARLLSNDYRLPSLPSLYFRILRAMESPDASIEEVGEIIAQDPAMTAKILQVVNSAYFGLARRISNITEAVQLLGTQKVRSMALSTQVFSCFDQARMKSFPLSRVWNHSIAASQIAQKICRMERVDKATAEEAQLACMLHDVGKVVLASGDPDRYQEAVNLAAKRQVPMIEVETEFFGASHADVGAYLLGLWGLPISVIEAIALHHAPDRTVLDHFTPLTAVHVANHLENEMSGPALDAESVPLDTDYLARIGCEGRIDDWREAVQEVEILASAGGR